MVPSRPGIGAMSDAIGCKGLRAAPGRHRPQRLRWARPRRRRLALAPLRFLRVRAPGYLWSRAQEKGEREASRLCSRWQRSGTRKGRGEPEEGDDLPREGGPEGGVGSKNVFKVLQDAMATTTTTVASKISKGSRA